MATDWTALLMDSLPKLFDMGVGAYDIYNKGQVAGGLADASTSPLIDPFGANNRAYYQGQLRNLYSDPSYLEQLPSYQFALQQGEKGVDRGAAKMGHYLSSNRLYDLQKHGQGLASQTYNTEADRLASLAGSQFQPNAAAYAALQQNSLGMQAGQPSAIGKTGNDFFDILKGLGDSPIGDAAKEALGLGGEDSSTIDSIKEALGLGGGTPDFGGFDGAVGDANFYGDAPAGSGGELTPGGSDAGADSLYGDMPGPSTAAFNPGGGFGTFGQGANAVDDLYQYNAPAEGLSGVGAGAAAAGGALGAYGLTNLLGTEGTNASHATNALGGVGGSIAGGAAAGAFGATGGGMAAGAAAGGAAAAPLIPLALAMMAYGGYSEEQAMSGARKEAAGQLDQYLTNQAGGGANWDSPYGNFYINQPSLDMWASGDIDRGMGLYDQADHNRYLGNFNWDTGKYEDRDFLLSEGFAHQSMAGLNPEQRAAQQGALVGMWDDVSTSPNFGKSLFAGGLSAGLPYQRSGYGIQGGEGGSGRDENYWVNSGTGQIEDQGLLDMFNASQQRAATSGGDGGGEGVMTYGGQSWQLGSGAGSGGGATFADYNQHQAEQAARQQRQENAP